MKDQLLKSQNENPDVSLERERDIDVEVYNKEKNDKFIAYNENISVLNPVYTSLTPIRKVIVRCFVTPSVEDSNGVLRNPTIFVKKPTESGFGIIGEVETPFPFSRKAIVVSVPDNLKQSLSPGDMVLLSEDQVVAFASGKGDNAEIVVRNAFIRRDILDRIPSNPENEHYGYLLIDYANIEIKL